MPSRPTHATEAPDEAPIAPTVDPGAPASLLGRLSWSVVGGLVGGAALFVMNVVAGRVLGPEGYGQAAVAFALANVCLIACTAGLDLSAARGVARAHADRAEAVRLASSALAGVAIAGTVVAVLLVLARDQVGELIGQPGAVVAVAAGLGALLALRSLLDRTASGVHRFRGQAFGRSLEGVAGVAAIVVIAVVVTEPRWWLLPAALAVAAVVAIAVYAATLRDLLRPAGVSFDAVRRLGRFGRWAIVAYVTGTLFMFGDKLVVSSLVGNRELGIYNAYYMTSMALMVQLVAVFNNVLLPAVARGRVDHALVQRLDRAALRAVPLAALAVCASIAIALELFGAGFPLRAALLVAFVAWCLLFGLNQVYAVLVTVHSEAAYRRDMLLQPVRIAFAIAVLVTWVQVAGPSLEAVLAALIAAELFEQANIQWILRRYVPRLDAHEGAAA